MGIKLFYHDFQEVIRPNGSNLDNETTHFSGVVKLKKKRFKDLQMLQTDLKVAVTLSGHNVKLAS